MTDTNWERLAAGTGVAAAALLAVQGIIAGLPPPFDEPAEGVLDYYREDVSAVRAQLFLLGLAGMLLLWFLGSLRSHLRQAEGGTGRLSAVAFGAGIAATGPISAGVLAAAALTQGVEDPVAANILHDLRLLSYTMSWFALGPLAAATAIVALRTGVFPGWHVWFGYSVFAAGLLAGLGIFVDNGTAAPGGLIAYVVFALFLAWLAATSILMVRRLAAPEDRTLRE